VAIVPEQDQDQGNPDYSWPEPAHDTGVLGTIADVAEMANAGTEWIPLIGTATNLGLAAIEGGRAIYDGHEAKNAYADGDNARANTEMQAAEKREDSMIGHFINAIPLVGTARALM
jgi:hypothetical protein